MAEKKQPTSKSAKSTEFNLEDISIKSIIRDVLRRILLIVLAMIVMASAFYIYTCESYKPQYTSSTTFLVSTRDGSYDAYSNLNTTVQLNQVFKMILDSSALQEAVKKDLGLNVLDATINASVVEETNLLVLSVTAGTPRDSYDILCSVVENYPTFSSEVMGNAVMDVFDAPSVPTRANNSNGAFRRAIMGALFGAVLSFALVVALSFLKDTVKNEHQLEDKLDTRLFGTVPHENRRKRAGLLVSDVTSSFAFEEAYNKLRSRIEREKRNHGYKAFAISSSLENEGKTTVASNIAIVLARQNYKVLIVDFDFRRPALYRIFEQKIDDDKNFSNYFAKDNEKSILDFVVYNKKNKIDMLLATSEIENINRALKRSMLSDIITELKQSYDYIIIDTPPVALVSDVDDVIGASDASLLVVREDEAKAMIINDSIDLLIRTEKPLIGAILNDSLGTSTTYGYAYSGQYGKGYRYGYGRYGRYGKYGKYGKYSASSRHSSGKEDK